MTTDLERLAALTRDGCDYPGPCDCPESDCICHTHGFRVVHGHDVARFRDAQGKPLLREPCTGPEPHIRFPKSPAEYAAHRYCLLCQGRSWVPVPPERATDALLEAADSAGWKVVVLTHFPSGVYNCILFPSGPEFLAWVEEKKDYPGSDGATRQEALAAALWDAEEAATTVH